jgi:peroxiredoxin
MSPHDPLPPAEFAGPSRFNADSLVFFPPGTYVKGWSCLSKLTPPETWNMKLLTTAALGFLLLFVRLVNAEDAAPEKQPAANQQPAADKPADSNNEVLAGHSYHGEFLNEGPRQAAYLMGGTGHVKFPVTTENELAGKFIEQGVGQLYGFWYLEAERSFRQAAALDKECAMAYWGAALATIGNEKRTKGFIAEAVKRKDKASERERMYIEALDAYIQAGSGKKKERAEKYTEALESIALKFPDDVEAKAFLALQLYSNRSAGIKTLSHLAIDGLIQEIFKAEPLHSAHHFRIHLWDYKKAEKALTSAAVCGQSSPSIAHMWHMPGHIYSRLKRYEDACYQQEASARVDHAHMMRDRVMPDEIHNFAHNNEWLIRNLNYVGRVRDAIDLAKNMIQLPRHPRYNTLSRSGSSNYGRQRLFETLERYELWSELIELCNSTYLEPTDDFNQQVKRLRQLGVAYFRTGDIEHALAQLTDLQNRLNDEQSARDKAVKEAEEKAKQEAVDQKAVDQAVADAEAKAKNDGGDDAQIDAAKTAAADKSRAEQLEKNKKKIEDAAKNVAKPFDSKTGTLEKAIAEIEGEQSVAQKDFKNALEKLKKAGGVDPMYLALIRLQAGETDAAIADARNHVSKETNEVQPLACLVDLLWRAGKQDDAKKAFEQLREMSSSIDMASPVFERLKPIAAELGFSEDWRVQKPPRDDVGERPPLDSLGPFRWQPSPAAAWELLDADGQQHSLRQYTEAGKPVVVIFYLGFGCLHCAEQLQKFAPMMKDFNAVGVEMIAVSTDNREDLKRSIDNYDDGKLPIPLVANADLDVFKAYRAYDDFEQQALHGTFLIDPKGLVLWQDIGHEPFMEPKFLLDEAQRLLEQRKSYNSDQR